MACSHHDSSTVIAALQLFSRPGEFEPHATKAKEDRTKIRPHGMRDSVHVDPQHVWGDEGPVNE